jgi:hypothetical protein
VNLGRIISDFGVGLVNLGWIISDFGLGLVKFWACFVVNGIC